MKVLLVSPLDPKKPGNLKYLMGGESTYTQTLLAHPPKGVTYTHHLEALKQGQIEYLPVQKFLANLVKSRLLPTSPGSQCLQLHEKFDLIHCHGYSIKIIGPQIPIIISDSSSNYLFLRDYLNWPEWRIKIGYRLRRLLFNKLDVIDCDTNWQKAQKVIVFSKFAFDIHQQLKVPKKKLTMIAPGLPNVVNQHHHGPSINNSRFYHSPASPDSLQNDTDGKVNILFVGIWFERKGGPLVLEAFKILSQKYPNIRLTIVGPIPSRYKRELRNYSSSDPAFSWKGRGSREVSIIDQVDFVPRQKLLTDYFPTADILVLVPPQAEGFGFVVLEAMSFGIPTIVSRIYALPELVENNKTGFIIEPSNLAQLVSNLEVLITNQKLRQKMGQTAQNRFNENFSLKTMNEKLAEVYQMVTESHLYKV